ncbi:alanine dehydrogenase [Natribacillus halophilus]|uniref:Alanine dehydrogenase n=1 Tax=Natribacillus halophilus TaxID=549003 RepID=A0A1G8JX06_9BACI|nr:alanine dehydrogenase [Natribacillus halophilus]SDI35711.1 L-alanine dehydrogenase [Natribacillus halophilus]
MIIGVPKEIKAGENRVGLTPAGVQSLVNEGHQVFVETNAGAGSGFTDAEYGESGADVLDHPKDVWTQVEMVVKVKEPQVSEFQYFHRDLILFTYLHLAAEAEVTKALVENGVNALAFETVEVEGKLPLLTPMSEVAGRMAAQLGAQFLEKTYGGKGILLSGVPGVTRSKVTIIGGGTSGVNAAKIAIGLGASVTIIDVNPERLRELDDLFGNEVQTLISNPVNIAEAVKDSALVIGAVLIPGAKAPTLVTEEMIKAMTPGSVVLDVAIDQGGIFETGDRITTHEDPVFVKHDVVHYAVANIPGAVPRTATIALTNVTLPYVTQVANLGVQSAIEQNNALQSGLNVSGGYVTHKAVAEELGYSYVAPNEVFLAGKA